MVLGGHGDDMVPVLTTATDQRRARARSSSPKDKLDAIVERTRNGGGEIVKPDGHERLLRAGASARSRWPRPSSSTRSACSPCAAYLDGEYGYKDLFMGVPVVIGGGGVEKIVEIQLTADEKAMLDEVGARRARARRSRETKL